MRISGGGKPATNEQVRKSAQPSPLRERGLLAPRNVYFSDNCFQYAVDVLNHIIVPEPDDPIAMLLDQLGPRRVLSLAMLPAVQFDNQTETPRGKVGDIRANGKLFDEFGVFQLPVAQSAPQLALGFGHIAAERTGSPR